MLLPRVLDEAVNVVTAVVVAVVAVVAVVVDVAGAVDSVANLLRMADGDADGLLRGLFESSMCGCLFVMGGRNEEWGSGEMLLV